MNQEMATTPAVQITVPAVRAGCPKCSYNSKYGTIYCAEHRGW